MNNLISEALSGWLQRMLDRSNPKFDSSVTPYFPILTHAENTGVAKLVYQKIHEKGITTKQIPFKTLLMFLEGYARESDLFLKELWINLLVTYLDAEKNLTTNALPSILSELTVNEVKILRHAVKFHSRILFNDIPVEVELKNQLVLSREEIENLQRLRLLEARIEYTFRAKELDGTPNEKVKRKKNDVYDLAPLGKLFLNACE
ncbi:Abi-alpha family protein [Dyadobacter sp. 32]|uniref:Abi-alpha family protein n=1 Tax=Dyadobacter sp. 32 TaxID=538966 RepID=UPI0011EF6CF0